MARAALASAAAGSKRGSPGPPDAPLLPRGARRGEAARHRGGRDPHAGCDTCDSSICGERRAGKIGAMKPISIRGKPAAGGRLPLLCAPLVGATREALLEEAATVH